MGKIRCFVEQEGTSKKQTKKTAESFTPKNDFKLFSFNFFVFPSEMCMETMDFTSTYLKPGDQRKNVISGSKPRLRLLDEDQALERGRHGDAIKMTVRKYLHLQQRQLHLAKDLANHGDLRKKPTGKARRRAEARVPPQAPGAMAPKNTTQYLMGNVYADMTDDHEQAASVSHLPTVLQYGQSPSPNHVYSALDTDYESFLSYQQKDFEETFPLCWEPC